MARHRTRHQHDPTRPPFTRPKVRGWGWIVLLAVIVAARWWWGGDIAPPKPEIAVEGTYQVDRVVDGDTLRLADGTRVRLQGIDTPETVKDQTPVEPWGPEASEYTKHFIAVANDRVRLTFDKERVDQYGRLLAYVWNGERLLNEELVREGLARARPDYPQSDSMRRRLRKAQNDARQARRGLWSGESPKPFSSRSGLPEYATQGISP